MQTNILLGREYKDLGNYMLLFNSTDMFKIKHELSWLLCKEL